MRGASVLFLVGLSLAGCAGLQSADTSAACDAFGKNGPARSELRM